MYKGIAITQLKALKIRFPFEMLNFNYVTG